MEPYGLHVSRSSMENASTVAARMDVGCMSSIAHQVDDDATDAIHDRRYTDDDCRLPPQHTTARVETGQVDVAGHLDQLQQRRGNFLHGDGSAAWRMTRITLTH